MYFDFVNPTEQLRSALMSVGGEVMPHTGAPDASKHLVVVPSDRERRARLKKKKKVRFAEPLPCKHGIKKRTCPYRFKEKICKKCGISDYEELRKQLRSVAMTEDEITHVSRLYRSCSTYEKSVGALTLPPISDSIYRVPELPPSLREALKEVEGDYMLS
ncbi:hypothetical protein PYW08_009826 [Mythimna loreyi]|uniref:Uncharacterized protein n=1 Tax=Mythimna loreyi TaxID=667449 RepID=A0ACC2Q759_9NEOP|nr:hypothetical protein PYW08_009826 [Mythimna loreyi]